MLKRYWVLIVSALAIFASVVNTELKINLIHDNLPQEHLFMERDIATYMINVLRFQTVLMSYHHGERADSDKLQVRIQLGIVDSRRRDMKSRTKDDFNRNDISYLEIRIVDNIMRTAVYETKRYLKESDHLDHKDEHLAHINVNLNKVYKRLKKQFDLHADISVKQLTAEDKLIAQFHDELWAVFFVLLMLLLLMLQQNRAEQKATTKLKASEERFRDYANSTADWFWEQDKDLKFTMMGHQLLVADGITAQDHIGFRRDELPVNHFPDSDLLREHMATLNRHEPFKNFIIERVVNDQHNMITVSGVPVFNDKGVFTGYRGSSSDVTEVHRQQEETRKTERKLAAVINNIPFCFYMKDLDGRHLLVNKTLEETFGTTQEEMLGKKNEDFMNEAAAVVCDMHDRLVIRLKKAQTTDELIQHPDGSFHNYVSVKFPLLDAKGEAYAFAGISMDVTEKLAQDTIINGQADRFNALLKNSQDLLYSFNLASGTYDYIGPNIETLTGYTPEEYTEGGLEFAATMLHPDDKEALEFHINQLLSGKVGKMTPTIEYRIKNKDPEIAWKWVSDNRTIIFNEEGEPVSILGSCRDITQSKEDYALLEQKKIEAEQANRTKLDFLATMSHELRTPLNAVIGFSDMLTANMVGELTEKQHGFVGNINEAGNHLLGLIGDILDIAKIESGRAVLDSEPESLDKIVKFVEDIYTLKISEETNLDFQIIKNFDCDKVDVDAIKIKQILTNIMNNAVKFTQTGGITFEIWNDTMGLHFSVADTGIGIAPDELDKVFEPFHRTEQVQLLAIEGTGLGLSLVKQLVELHGGTVKLTSDYYTGTQIQIDLPLERIL